MNDADAVNKEYTDKVEARMRRYFAPHAGFDGVVTCDAYGRVTVRLTGEYKVTIWGDWVEVSAALRALRRDFSAFRGVALPDLHGDTPSNVQSP